MSARARARERWAPGPRAAPGSVPELFGVEVCPDRDRVRVVVIGELDLATADVLKRDVDELYDVGFEQLVLDLTRLSFMDCTGLRAILCVAVRARASGAALELVGVRGQVKRLLALCGGSRRLGLCVQSPPELSRNGHPGEAA